MAQKFLGEVELTDSVRTDIVDACKHFHKSACRLSERYLEEMARHVYITHTSYLEIVTSFKTLLGKKRNEVRTIYSTLLYYTNYTILHSNYPLGC